GQRPLAPPADQRLGVEGSGPGRHRRGLIGLLDRRAARRPVRAAHRRTRRRGFRTSSRAEPTRVKARTTKTMHTDGGTTYHHAPRPRAPADSAALRTWPHDGANGSPRPMNERVVSVRIEPPNTSTVLATIRFMTLGRMCRHMMCPGPEPITRARPTKASSFTERACDRMIRAVDAQLVTP